MTNTQLYLAYIIPTVLVLIGILMNRSDNQATRAELHALRGDTRADLQALRGAMVTLRNQIHTDMVALHERVAVVEAKQG